MFLLGSWRAVLGSQFLVLGSWFLVLGPSSSATSGRPGFAADKGGMTAEKGSVPENKEARTTNQELRTRNKERRTKNEGQRATDRRQRTNLPERRIVISIPDKKLALVEDGRVRKVYPIAVGASSSPTPTGQMRIIDKLIAPTYCHRGRIIPPGKSNPLGSRWLGLSKGGYGIHGTNVPSSIGKAVSHGCIRMRKQDIEDLFEWVGVDDVVEVRTERDTRWAGIFEGTETTSYAAPEPPLQAEPQPSPVAAAVMAGQF